MNHAGLATAENTLGFAALMAAMDEQLHKAEALEESGKEDDKKIKAAATDAGVAVDEPADEETDDEAETDDEDEEGEPMGKSFSIELEDGTQIDAVDGTALVKSLMDKQGEQAGVLAKALESITAIAAKQNEILASQGELLKSLATDLANLRNQGRGPKSATASAAASAAAVLAKSTAASEQKPEMILAKCLAAQASGALSAFDVCRARTAVNMGAEIPNDITSRLG